MSGPLRLRLLRSDDAPMIRIWILNYLKDHLGWWSEAVYNEPWSAEASQKHIEEHDLVGVHWRDLARASESADCFVRVACDADRPIDGQVGGRAERAVDGRVAQDPEGLLNRDLRVQDSESVVLDRMDQPRVGHVRRVRVLLLEVSVLVFFRW